ncbi:hypothetical protein [Methylobacterium radiotolerans]|uniref:hypothetical protein n=1 Tax=Methylobacterium radiotolerans TaxID=31998 RepID=UPI000975AF83|nr:hypothetical protein [Methylobacterium radiotolerans]
MRIQARPARPSARSGVRSILRPGLVGALAALGTVGAQAAPACPARDFPGFLAAFADDVAVQKAFVAVPLRSDTIDPGAEPEPKPVTTMLGADALRFPLMPSLRTPKTDGLKQALSAAGADAMRVKLFKPDTGLQITYTFRRAACWTLVRIEDDSL